MAWELACPDWEQRVIGRKSLVPDLPKLDQAFAAKAVGVFNSLRLPDVPDRPTFAEAGADWFREIVAALFGSVDPIAQRRMVREILLLIAKKNNKTTGGAGLMLTGLLLNRRPRAEFQFIGPTQAISDLAFDQAVGMIDADDIKQREIDGQVGYLKRILHVQDHLKKITYRGEKAANGATNGTGARLRVRTFSDEILTGPRPSGVFLDEIHLLGKDAKAANIVGQLRGGMITNMLAFLVMATTQSDEPPAGVFLQELTNARMIRDGKIAGGHLLPIMYEFPDFVLKDEGWRNPENWGMVNPNLGLSIPQELLESEWNAAQNSGDIEIKRFASQHFNVQIGIALKSNAWSGAEYWEQNGDPNLTLDEILSRCDVVTIGIDGGGLDDLFGLSIIGRVRDDGTEVGKRKWLHWAHAWCHKSTLEQRKDIASRLRDFERDGDLTIVQTVGDDVFEIADLIESIEAKGLLPEKNAIGVDSFGYGGVIEELGARSFNVGPGERTVGIPQGWQLNGAISDVARRLAGSRITHCGKPMMAWVCSNAKVEQRGNAVSITKQISGKSKIDPLMATFNASVLMAKNPVIARKPEYQMVFV